MGGDLNVAQRRPQGGTSTNVLCLPSLFLENQDSGNRRDQVETQWEGRGGEGLSLPLTAKRSVFVDEPEVSDPPPLPCRAVTLPVCESPRQSLSSAYPLHQVSRVCITRQKEQHVERWRTRPRGHRIPPPQAVGSPLA